jgi:Glycoside hydrolase 123, catalytic domain/Glycoside hydrolase 123 N-terminal domain
MRIFRKKQDKDETKIHCWVDNSLVKNFPHTRKPKNAQKVINLKSAKNETADFQIFLRPRMGLNLEKVTFEFSDLKSSEATITKDHLRGNWIWYTHVLKNPPQNKLPNTYLKKAPNFFPDAFLEEDWIRILRGWTQPLWVSIDVPTDSKIPAGIYSGSVKIHCIHGRECDKIADMLKPKQSTDIEIEINLEVWPFSLPEINTIHHTEWFFPDLLARSFRVQEYSEKFWKLIENVAEDMVKHHQDMILTNFYHLVRITKKSDGTLDYDFTNLGNYLDIFKKAGIRWIEGGHIGGRIGGWNSPIATSRWKAYNENGEEINDFSREKMPEDEFLPLLQTFLTRTYAFLATKWDLNFIIQHVADEPVKANKASWEKLNTLVKSCLPKEVKTIDAALIKGTGNDFIRVPQIHHIKSAERIDTENFEKNLWCYVCLAPQGKHPNRFLDYASIRNRIIFWIMYSLKLEGFLHWGYNYWGSWVSSPDSVYISPWIDATAGSAWVHHRQRLPAGDPFIVYPGRKGICSSIRWEVIRKGFEDHKLITLLEEKITQKEIAVEYKNEGALILDDIRKNLAKESSHYTRDEALFLEIRDKIGDLLAKIVQNTD